ncbi:MAG: hypothetical protein L0220_05885 [Acidobacteria bacterium]|nr:hypothetical protein [Acidobacteriota bacterium]
MRVQTYRTKIQNGVVSKRRNRPAVSQASRRPVRKRESGRKGEKGSSTRVRRSGASGSRRSRQRQRGANVLWMLMLVGAFLACGFVFAMRSQINVYQLGQAEAQLKGELDEMANRQRYEMLQRERALNPRKIERAAKQAGLVQPGLKLQNNPTNQDSKKQKTVSKKSL